MGSPGGSYALPGDDTPYEIGGVLIDGLYTPPERPPIVSAPIPASISDRQFFQQLAIVGIITQDQALASNAAVIPAPLLTIIDAMPEDQQFAAKMLIPALPYSSEAIR